VDESDNTADNALRVPSISMHRNPEIVSLLKCNNGDQEKLHNIEKNIGRGFNRAKRRSTRTVHLRLPLYSIKLHCRNLFIKMLIRDGHPALLHQAVKLYIREDHFSGGGHGAAALASARRQETQAH
jgi:hypothetical protein